MEMYPKLGEGYRLVQLFKDFWHIDDKEEAEGYLAFWCDIANDSGIFPFRTVVKRIKAHWSGIINYIESKINNGILEGINSKIQLAKKRARGYKNIGNFSLHGWRGNEFFIKNIVGKKRILFAKELILIAERPGE